MPRQRHDAAVIFAAASLIAPLFIVLLGLAAGESDVSSPLYSLAAVVFVAALGAFVVASCFTFRARRVENALLEEERTRVRQARRLSASTRSSRTMSSEAQADTRRAS